MSGRGAGVGGSGLVQLDNAAATRAITTKHIHFITHSHKLRVAVNLGIHFPKIAYHKHRHQARFTLYAHVPVRQIS